jgi:hypothetical protein
VDALTVRLSERQADVVARAAEREGRSRGEIIRRAVDAYATAAGRGSPDPVDRAVAWLTAEGVDVPRAMASAGAGREGDAIRARAAVDRAMSIAVTLRAAERKLLAEARGLNEGCTGFTRATLGEASGRGDALTAALSEACLDDPALVRQARRAAD